MKKVTIKLKEMNIMSEMFYLLVPITLNKRKGILLVDTGASRTVFDTEQFKRFKTKSKIIVSPMNSAAAGGNLNTQLTLLKKLQVDKITLKNYVPGIADLSHMNGMFTSFKYEPIDGVLGADVLRSHGATLDFKNKTLSFEFNQKKVDKENAKYVTNIKKHLNL